ncbi:hypothetical protein [Chitinophaga sp. OAE865]|uniref:LIC11966 family surface protein n=1 Tax=Chitinophaga sp. OAE865 TaxID=2817898 RepID=UPI001AE3137B
MNNRVIAKAESVHKTWVEQLDKSIAEVNRTETIKVDGGLKPAVEQGLKDYGKIAGETYKELIGLRTKEKSGDTSVQPQIQAALNRINQSFESIGGNINKAGDEFVKKHNKPYYRQPLILSEEEPWAGPKARMLLASLLEMVHIG